jgi:hypothetical protein
LTDSSVRYWQIRDRHWAKRETEKTIKEVWSAKVPATVRFLEMLTCAAWTGYALLSPQAAAVWMQQLGCRPGPTLEQADTVNPDADGGATCRQAH